MSTTFHERQAAFALRFAYATPAQRVDLVRNTRLLRCVGDDASGLDGAFDHAADTPFLPRYVPTIPPTRKQPVVTDAAQMRRVGRGAA